MEVARRADAASKKGDLAELFSIVRLLRGGRAKPHKAVRGADGQLLVEPEQIDGVIMGASCSAQT
jgi:hypothetical protein